MKKILTIWMIICIGLFADTQNPERHEKYIKQGYEYKPTNCSYTCEELKDGYFARVSNVNVEKGTITCNIYADKNPLKVLSSKTLVNNFCKKEYTFVANSNKENPSSPSLNAQLKQLETKYFKNFINTGDVQFLTAPEYLVAVLTANAEVINIKDTIEENTIILNQGYTIFPNELVTYEKNFIDKISSLLVSILPIDEPSNNITTPIDNFSKELTSSTSQLISTIGVFWLDFLTESNFLYQETNMLIILILAPFSFIIMTGETITQKMSKMNSQTNWVGSSIVSALVCLSMFMTYNVAETGEEDIFGKPKNLDQSFYQDNTSFMFTKGVIIANSFNATFNKVYINQMARNASLSPLLSQENRKEKLAHLIKIAEVYDTYMNTCFDTYNVQTLSAIATSVYNLPMNFPANEKYSNLSFYQYLKNKEDLFKHNLYSVSSCYEVNRQEDLLRMRIDLLTREIEDSKIAISNNMVARILNVAEVGYKNTVEMGFLSALTTATMNSTLANIEDYQHHSDNIEARRDYIKRETQKSMRTNDEIAIENILETDVVSTIPKILPYFAMPFFSDIYNRLESLILPEKKESINSFSIGGAIGDVILSIATKTIGLPFLEALVKSGGVAVVTGLSIWVYEFLLNLLVPFAILSGGLLVVLFWIAEIVIYYLVIPFMLAYAMLKSQGHATSKFLARGLIISARPTLIVFSIIVAVLLNELYESVSIFIITKNFSALFGLNELGMIDTFTGLMQQGFFEIALRFLIPILMFFIILIGSTMFLKQFGYSDEADFGQQLSSGLESKGGKYSMPI